MRLDPHRLTLWLALFATGATYLALSPSYRQAVTPVSESPWIGLPDSGMDASDLALRELFNPDGQGGRRGDAFLDLAWICGGFLDKNNARFAERYIAHVSDDGWNPRWGIIIDVEQDQVLFSLRSDDFLPPPSINDANAGDMITIRPVRHLRMHKSRAEPIRQAWNNAALWHAPQKQNFCMDGGEMMLEACIHGRYAMRNRTCDRDAHQAAETLRAAFKALLPTPEPVYQRPTPQTSS
jgi:hypothetical protein